MHFLQILVLELLHIPILHRSRSPPPACWVFFQAPPLRKIFGLRETGRSGGPASLCPHSHPPSRTHHPHTHPHPLRYFRLHLHQPRHPVTPRSDLTKRFIFVTKHPPRYLHTPPLKKNKDDVQIRRSCCQAPRPPRHHGCARVQRSRRSPGIAVDGTSRDGPRWRHAGCRPCLWRDRTVLLFRGRR